jgi:glycosyltransferase involved in cell wall biosynthesis
MKPFLSILIPTYNRAQMTLEAIASVGNNPEVEIVVVDDCSDDYEYTKLLMTDIEHGTLRLFRNELNLGMTKNFNRCMQLATGDWFGLIGSDDYYKPGAIDRAVAVLKKLQPSLVVYSRDSKGWRKEPGVDTVRTLRLPSGSGNFWHRLIYEDLGGFDERLLYSPDAEYWYRMIVKYPLVEVPERYCEVRSDHGDNLAYKTWRKPDFLEQIKLITRLNMVHRGEDITDLDLVVANESMAVWDTVLYILRVTAGKPEKHDIFDMYIGHAVTTVNTKEKMNIINSLVKKRREK